MYKNERDSFFKECCTKDLKSFFIWMSLFSIGVSILFAYLRNYINDGNIWLNRFMEYGAKVISTIPIFILINYFKRKNTLNPNDIGGIILNVIEYFYIICGIFMPFVEITTNASFEMSDTMLMLLCAFIMFFIGEIGKIRLLRRLSYVWIAIPWLIFGMYHLFEIYYQHWGIRVIPSDIVVMFIWIKTLCYKICPSLGYLIIAFQIKKLIA